MAPETKSDLVEELSSQSTKAELVELLGSRLKKDEISKLLDDESDGTKEELLRKLGSRRKDELVEAVESRLTKDEIEKAVAAGRDDDEGEDEAEERSGSPRSHPLIPSLHFTLRCLPLRPSKTARTRHRSRSRSRASSAST